MMSFAWPWIFLLLPLPLLLVMRATHNRKSDNAIKVPPSVAAALRHAQLDKPAALNAHTLKFVLLALAWVSLLTAIAQPYLPKATTAQPASGRALSMLVDLSTSMERKDFQIDDEAVDRLTVVKGIASRFIENRSGDRLGLVLFGTEAFIASPLTYDLNAVATTLQSSGIGMAGRTTAMGDALGLAIKSLRDDPAQEKAIVLLSDGTNNAGTAEPEDAAKLARSFGITIYTIGLGSDDATDSQQQFQSASADLDEATLQAIAQTSGGKFFRAHTTAALEKIYTEIDTVELAQSAAPPIIIKRDYRNIFILLLLCCLAPLLLIESVPRLQNNRRQNNAKKVVRKRQTA